MPTLVELKAEAKKLGLKGYSKLKKAELEKLITGKKDLSKYAPGKIPSFKGAPDKKTEKDKVIDKVFSEQYENILENEIRDVGGGEKKEMKELERASKVALKIINKMLKDIYNKAKNDRELKDLGKEWLKKNY